MPRKPKAKLESRVEDTTTAVATPEAPVAQMPEPKESIPTHIPNGNIFNKPEGELVVDIFETGKEFVVLTAIAGVQIEDLDIAVEEDMMIISGQRVNPAGNSDKKYFSQECYWGAFQRKIVLPNNINTKAADAQINKGILTITIPKLTS